MSLQHLMEKNVFDVLELRKYLYNHKKVGDTMTVKYYRAGVENEATLKLTDETRM